jgi:hypothetical protein
MEPLIHKAKREHLILKYNLLKFPNIKQPVLFTIDEFFDGNNDEGSISSNFETKLPISEYY